MRVINI